MIALTVKRNHNYRHHGDGNGENAAKVRFFLRFALRLLFDAPSSNTKELALKKLLRLTHFYSHFGDSPGRFGHRSSA